MTLQEIDITDPCVRGHMATQSGILVNLLNVDPDTINLGDIAHGLAYNFRWNGHTKLPYTVAEHCIRVADRAPGHLKFAALFHDAEEAYWGDIIGPIKMLLKELAPEILEKMRETRAVIFNKYNIGWGLLEEVRGYDQLELNWDFENLILNKTHTPLSPEEAKQKWLSAVLNA